MQQFLEQRFLASDPDGLAAIARLLCTAPDRTDELAAAGVPVLVAYGEDDDAWPPAVQDDMARRLGVASVVLDGAAHSPAAERPADTSALLAGWWRALPARSG